MQNSPIILSIALPVVDVAAGALLSSNVRPVTPPLAYGAKRTEANRGRAARTEGTDRRDREELKFAVFPRSGRSGKSRKTLAGELNTTDTRRRRYLRLCMCIVTHTVACPLLLARRVNDKERRLVASPVASPLCSPARP